MNVEAVAPREQPGWRAVPWAVWVLLIIAGLIFVRSLTAAFSPIGAFAFAAPVLFAAGVIYIAPQDRRFVWAALALAAAPAVAVVTNWLPDAWFSVAPGDWKNAVPLLQDIGGIAQGIAGLLGPIGLVLFGLALGGVRTFMSAVIITFGALVAAALAVWFILPLQGLPLLDLVRSIGFAALNIVGWAFVFAAALESLRTLTLIATGLLFANTVINALLLIVWRPQPGFATDVLTVVLSLPEVIGWLVLIAAVLRGELSAAPAGALARSRAGRGSAVRRRAD